MDMDKLLTEMIKRTRAKDLTWRKDGKTYKAKVFTIEVVLNAGYSPGEVNLLVTAPGRYEERVYRYESPDLFDALFSEIRSSLSHGVLECLSDNLRYVKPWS